MSTLRRFVALLRGVNVGGRALVPMAELRKVFESFGSVEVKTLLQSGNVVFKSAAFSAGTLEASLEKTALAKWDRPIDLMIKDEVEWKNLIARNPFLEEAKRAPNHLLVMVLKNTPPKDALATLKAAISGTEYFHSIDRCLYLVYPAGIGRSKFSLALIEKKLGIRGTARNWNTVQKIAAMLGSA